MSIDPILDDWLTHLGLQTTPEDILTGNTLHLIFKKCLKDYDNEFISPPSTNKILNWNNLVKTLQKTNISISTEQKSHIIQGNFKTHENLLLQVKSYFDNQKEYLNKIDIKADPKQTKSLLQLFVLILMRNLSLNMKQSVALLSNDSKYLAHVLAKGFKDQTAPVINLLKDFQTYLPQIQQFCINKDNQIFFLKSLKPGLISRFRQISELSLQILVQFSLQTQYPLETMKNHLLSTMVLQYRRHPGLIEQTCSAIIKLSKFSKSLLTILISDMNQKEFMAFCYQILCIAQNSNQLKLFYALTKFDELLSLCLDSLMDSNNFQIALLILIKILQTNSKIVVDDQKKLNKIVNNLQKLTLNKKQQTIIFVNGLFTLLDIFWREDVPITQNLYKLIIFKYKHTFTTDESVIYCHNFLTLAKEFPLFSGAMITMIVDVIVEKYEHFKESVLETDLEVLLNVLRTLLRKEKLPKSQKNLKQKSEKAIKHPEPKQINTQNPYEEAFIDEQCALRIFNGLSEMLLEDVNNSVTITKILGLIINAFENSQAVIQSTIRIIKVSLAIYFANIRKLSITKQPGMNGKIKIDESNFFIKRKNMEIEFFLKHLLSLNIQIINSNAEALLCYSYVQANAKSSTETSGLAKVISLLGNLSSLLKKYEEDLRQMEKSKKNTRKKSPQSQQNQKIPDPSPQLYNKKILAPGQNYVDYITKVSKISNDAQKGIQKFQKGFDDKRKKLLDEELKKMQQEQKMEQIQKKLTNKVLEKGIKINPKIQSLNKYLYEFDTKETEITKEAIYELRALHIFNPAEQQTNDLEGLKYVLKKYNKVLRVFYNQYGGKLKVSPTGVIEEQTEKQNLLHLSNVWRLFKDFELDEFMTIKQAQYLVQKLNTLKRKSCNDISLLDFEIFEDFIVQASFTMFTRPPKELLGYTIAGMVEETFYQFKMLAGQNKIDIRLFDDELTLVEQDESIAALNLELKRSPDYILPEGYKKIVEKKVEYYHSVSLNVFNQSYTDVIDVLDEILYEKFRFHIIQPFTEMVTNVYAKCLLSKKKQDSEQSKEKYFSLNVKKELFKFSGEDRRIARQVAFCLSEIVDSVQHGRKLIGKNKLNPKQLDEEKKRNEQQQQKKRQKRDQEIKKKLQLQKQQKQAKRNQEEEQKIKQIKKLQEQKTKRKQYEQSLKKKIQEYQQKRQIDKKKEQEEKNKEKLKEQEIYLKKRKNYLKVVKEVQKKRDQVKNSIQKVDSLKKDEKSLPRQKSKTLLRVKTNPLPLKDKISAKKLQLLNKDKNDAKNVPEKNQASVKKMESKTEQKRNSLTLSAQRLAPINEPSKQ